MLMEQPLFAVQLENAIAIAKFAGATAIIRSSNQG